MKNSNNKTGPACACGDGYQGKVTWKNNKSTGKCVIAECKVKNSNQKPGKECKCKKSCIGTIRWMDPTAVDPCSTHGENLGFNADLAKDKKGVSQSVTKVGRLENQRQH